MEKPNAILKNWSIDELCNIAYGDVYGHPRFDDGSYIHTSTIISIDREQKNIIVETLNTIYTLKRGDGLVGGRN